MKDRTVATRTCSSGNFDADTCLGAKRKGTKKREQVPILGIPPDESGQAGTEQAERNWNGTGGMQALIRGEQDQGDFGNFERVGVKKMTFPRDAVRLGMSSDTG